MPSLTMESIFAMSSPIMLVGWISLLVTPISPKWTNRVATYLAPALLSLAYTSLIFVYWAGAEGGFESLASVKQLFTQDEIVMAGWLHYLAFDLFVGAWIVRQARAAHISHWFIVPILPLTLMFGPIGYIVFLMLRLSLSAAKTSKSSIPSTQAV